MEFGLHPLFVIATGSLVGALVCLIFACIASHWLKRGVLIVAALFLLTPSGVALMVLKPELVDGRYKTYKQLYGDIDKIKTWKDMKSFKTYAEEMTAKSERRKKIAEEKRKKI